ncbi:MAG: hypothetical protein P8130_08425 [Deltaproteobacteria bacterium]
MEEPFYRKTFLQRGSEEEKQEILFQKLLLLIWNLEKGHPGKQSHHQLGKKHIKSDRTLVSAITLEPGGWQA